MQCQRPLTSESAHQYLQDNVFPCSAALPPPPANHGGHHDATPQSAIRLHLLDAWHESRLYSDRERAALAWAESLTNISTSRAPDDVYEQARKQFSEKELADLSIVIAMINAWNRLAIGARSVHPADRAKAA